MKMNKKHLMIIILCFIFLLGFFISLPKTNAIYQIPANYNNVHIYKDIDDYWICDSVNPTTYWATLHEVSNFSAIDYSEFQQASELRYTYAGSGSWVDSTDYFGGTGTNLMTTDYLYSFDGRHSVLTWEHSGDATNRYTDIINDEALFNGSDTRNSTGYNHFDFWIQLNTTNLDCRVVVEVVNNTYGWSLTGTDCFIQFAWWTNNHLYIDYTTSYGGHTSYDFGTYAKDVWYHVRLEFQSEAKSTNYIRCWVNNVLKHGAGNFYCNVDSFTQDIFGYHISTGNIKTKVYLDAIDTNIDGEYYHKRNTNYLEYDLDYNYLLFMKQSKYYLQNQFTQLKLDRELITEFLQNTTNDFTFLETLYFNKTSLDFHYQITIDIDYYNASTCYITIGVVAMDGVVYLSTVQNLAYSRYITNDSDYMITIGCGYTKIDSASNPKMLLSVALDRNDTTLYLQTLDTSYMDTNLQNWYLSERANYYGFIINESAPYNVSGGVVIKSSLNYSYETVRVGETYRYLNNEENLYISQFYFLNDLKLLADKFFSQQMDYGWNGTNPLPAKYSAILPGAYLPAMISFPKICGLNPLTLKIPRIDMIDVKTIVVETSIIFYYPEFDMYLGMIPFWIGGYTLAVIPYAPGGWINPINVFIFLVNMLLAGFITTGMLMMWLWFNCFMVLVLILGFLFVVIGISLIAYWVMVALIFCLGWILFAVLWVIINCLWILSWILAGIISLFTFFQVNIFFLQAIIYSIFIFILLFVVDLIMLFFFNMVTTSILFVWYFIGVLFFFMRKLMSKYDFTQSDVLNRRLDALQPYVLFLITMTFRLGNTIKEWIIGMVRD